MSGDTAIMTGFTYDRPSLALAKNHDHHFVLVYPNTPAGRTAARAAVRGWLANGELDFGSHDAEVFWKAIDVNRIYAAPNRFSEGDRRRGRRRRC